MARLDVEYVRACGNTLYCRDGDGDEFPVVDFSGGYGSLIFGHNDPEIIAHAKSVLDEQAPVYAQFSKQSVSEQVAAKLNEIVGRETASEEPYYAIFANTGAEAIECAVKHAEFDRHLTVSALNDEIRAHVEHAAASVRDGAAVVSEDAFELVGVGVNRNDECGFDTLAAAIDHRNAELVGSAPLFLALEGAFHGKLVGSVQLTHNHGYRAPFASMAAQARFVPVDQPGALAKIFEEEQAHLLDVEVRNGLVEVVERGFPVICAFLLEPIQGEGGIRAVTAEFAEEVQRTCEAHDCPIIIDEIQSGMGRTGAFLASSHVGLRGDYYAFAKSLGGGIAKSSAMLVRETRYRKEFELVHSSTFAKDGFSGRIALKTLEMLEADGGGAYARARRSGARLRTALDSVAADFPDVVKDVRGKGLMLGLEFRDQSESGSDIVKGLAQAGILGYVVSGYLLQEHRVRTLPTASSVDTLRFAPSIQVNDAEIEQLESALRKACDCLRDEDGQRLTGG